MSEVLDKIKLLTMHGVATCWPVECNNAIVRHYARRCASRSPSISKRIEPQGRRLEAACFMRYTLCTATDQVLTMLRRWVLKVINDASHDVETARMKAADQLREFARAVKALGTDESLSREDLGRELRVLADQVLQPHPPSRRSQIRQCLLRKRYYARNLLIRIVQLPFESETAHPVLDAIVVLRGLYRRHAFLLPDGLNIRLGRAWREAIDGYDRLKAMVAFEWAALFALRVALRNGTIFIEHSFSFRSQAHMLIPADDWRTKRNNLYGHLGLPQDPHEFLAPVLAQLAQRLEMLDRAAYEGKVRIDTAVHLEPLDAQPEDVEIDCPSTRPVTRDHSRNRQRDTIQRWILIGREPRSRIELLMVYSAVLAHGTSLTAAEISRMVPEISPAAIRQMMKRLEDERMLRLAADAVLEFMHEHPVAAH